jgi:hypothetical protein
LIQNSGRWYLIRQAKIHQEANVLIRKFDGYFRRTVEQGAQLALDATVFKVPESHGEYMSQGNI